MDFVKRNIEIIVVLIAFGMILIAGANMGG
jgi:hypothetical protein